MVTHTSSSEQRAFAETDRLRLLVKVARLYYVNRLGQEEIASVVGVSRSHVSRLLKEAWDRRIIRVHIDDPLGSVERLARRLQRAYGLREVLLVSPGAGSEGQIKRDLGVAAADYLRKVVRDGDIVGVSWGTTLNEVARSLQPRRLSGVTVVQVNGGISRTDIEGNPHLITDSIAKALQADAYVLAVPAIVTKPEIREGLERNRGVSDVLDLGRRCHLVLYSIGVPSEESVLVRSGYLTTADQVRLHERGAVGDICAHYFNAQGAICDPELETRTIGLDLDTLRTRERSIAVAGGPAKFQAILGALRGGYPNVLITDEATAMRLLETHENGAVRVGGDDDDAVQG